MHSRDPVMMNECCHVQITGKAVLVCRHAHKAMRSDSHHDSFASASAQITPDLTSKKIISC